MYTRSVSAFILAAYCALVVKLLVFKTVAFKIGHLQFNFSGTSTGPANFIPFKTIWPYLLGAKGQMIAIFELAGNIALLVPIGLLVAFVFRGMTWKKSLALAVATGLAIEVTQVLLHAGIFDVDDILLNALGVMIGYWLFVAFVRRSGVSKQ
jgi:glycopeptide antibiotics resistance protein